MSPENPLNTPGNIEQIQITEEAPAEVRFNKVDYTKTQAHRFYGNHASVSTTPFDLRLIVSDVDVVDGRVYATQTLTLLMSPELAKLTHTILGRAIESFERSNGPLRGKAKLPPQEA